MISYGTAQKQHHTRMHLLASELVYSFKQCDYNLVNSSLLHSMLNLYLVYCMLDAHN